MTYGKRPPLDEQKSLWEATIAVEGVTTGAGEGTGLSLIDAGLAGAGANSFVSMLVVIHPGESSVDSRDATAFNDGTGEVTVASAFKDGQVAAGVAYKIITFRFVPAEVAAIQADIGDASASALGSLYAILGDPAQTFLAMIGYEGALSLANKLTAARAALIDQITAARMQELDGANIPADVDTLLTRLSAIRAGYLDNLSAGAVALAANWTAALATALGNYTAARAGYLDELAAANLPTDIAALNTLLSDGTYGLAALEALVDDLETRLTAARAGYLDELDFDLQGTLATIAAYIDAEVASVLGLVDSAESVGPYSYLDAGGEQDVVEDTATTRRRICLEFSNRNMTQTGTFIIYKMTDGANYDIWDTIPVTVAAGDDRAWDAEFTTNQAWKLTYEEDINEGAARAIPYNVITQVIE